MLDESCFRYYLSFDEDLRSLLESWYRAWKPQLTRLQGSRLDRCRSVSVRILHTSTGGLVPCTRS